MTADNRALFLAEVEKLVNGDRNLAYDEPLEDFTCTAKMLTAFFGFEFQAWHVPVIMNCVKLSRLRKSPGRADHALDIAGYAACLYDVAPKE